MMKFSACGVEDIPHYDANDVRLSVLSGEMNSLLEERHFDIPVNTFANITFQDVINQLFDGKIPQQLTYMDDEGDLIRLGSESEWDEAVKVAQIRNVLPLFVRFPIQCGSERNISFYAKTGPSKFSEDNILKSRISEFGSDGFNKITADEQTLAIASEGDSANEKPPLWFTTHMEKFKQEMSIEIGKKITRKLQKLVNNGDLVLNERKPGKPDLLTCSEKRWSSKPTGFPQLWQGLELGLHTSSHGPGSTNSLPSSSPESSPTAWEGILPTTSQTSRVASKNLIHQGKHCHKCNSQLIGVWYKCGNCANFDLCTACEAVDSHCNDHVFIKIRKSMSIRTERKGGKPCPLLKHTIYQKESCEGIRRKHIEKRKLWDSGSVNSLQKSLHQSASVELGAPKAKNCNGNREQETGVLPRIELLKPVKSTMDAKFLFDETVPDGTKFLPGATFTKRWRMVNFGCKPWDHDTMLKFLWGTKGFTPTSMEVEVPNLLPRQNGTISVQYVAPVRPGFYESHWNFTHKGHLFGHRIWCSIEIVDPELNVDSADIDQINHLTEVQEPENGEKQNLKDDTENNLEAMNMPKSLVESESELTAQFKIPTLDLGSDKEAAVQDSDLASVVSLSSSSSESEYVVVPMPFCFNVPLIPQDNTSVEPHTPAIFQAAKRSPTSASSSVVFISPDGEENACGSQYNIAWSVDKPCVENDESHNDVQSQNIQSRQMVTSLDSKLEDLSKTFHDLAITSSNDNAGAFEQSENLLEVGQRRISLETGETFLIAGPAVNNVQKVEPFSFEALHCVNNPNIATDHSCTLTSNGNHEVEGLVSAATSIFNSARSALSALQWVQIPPDDNGDFIDPNPIYSPQFQVHAPHEPAENLPSSTLQ